tara:strand:+ start:407 stop:784 length:378 start_codon:yes stop_codon:yes gene_type:complete
MPSHRLNIPSVIVSTAKNSTVPKSEIVSINTRDKPAIIAGLAIGKATYKNSDLPCILATLNKFFGVEVNATLVIKYIYGYKANDKINIAPIIDRISGKKYSFGDCQLKISLKEVWIKPPYSKKSV